MTQTPGDGWVRWNTHHSTQVDVELFGCGHSACFGGSDRYYTSKVAPSKYRNTFHLLQNPNTNHLGTTVWDSSIVLAKFLEKNAKKGDFARHRLKGKRAIELGSGMGLGGFAFALLGCDTTVTDTAEVVGLLQRNYENNLSSAALRGQELSNMVGHVTVQELDWSNPNHYSTVNPPFDYVLAADCVYHEQIVEDFLRTVLAVTHSKSTVVVVNELRSESVHSRFTALFEQHFTIKRTPRSKMDSVHQHSAIDILILKRRKAVGSNSDVPAQSTEGPSEPSA